MRLGAYKCLLDSYFPPLLGYVLPIALATVGDCWLQPRLSLIATYMFDKPSRHVKAAVELKAAVSWFS